MKENLCLIFNRGSLSYISVVEHTEMYEREPLLKIRHVHKCKNILKHGNAALEIICEEVNPDLTELNEIIYATSKVLQSKCGIKSKKKSNKKKKTNKPKWQVKIDKEIENFRKDISILEELQTDKDVRSGKARKVIRKYQIDSKEKIPAIKEELKQKLQVKAQRLRRFTKSNKFYRQNKIFETDAKKFYREIGKTAINVDNIPSEAEVREFWNKILGNDKGHNENAEWLKNLEESANDIPAQQWEDISNNEVEKALRKTHKWKSPGIDQVPNFWLDNLSTAHGKLESNFNKIMTQPNKHLNGFA